MYLSAFALDLIIIIMLIVCAVAGWFLFVAYRECRSDKAYFLKLKNKNNYGNT